jgi:UDP-N-acetylmuramate--alanine ligase
MKDELARALEAADCVVVTEVFAAREAPPADGFSGQTLTDIIARQKQAGCVWFAASLEQAGDILVKHLRKDDVLLVLSAGDADRITEHLERELAARPATVEAAGRREANV